MHTTRNGTLCLNHNSDWSGAVCVIHTPMDWKRERPAPHWWVDGSALLIGIITPSDELQHEQHMQQQPSPLPPEIACRAVALAVYTYLTGRMISAVEQLSMPGGR